MAPLRALARFAFLGAAVVVLVLALFPPNLITAPGPDKLHHFLAFLALTLLGLLGWPEHRVPIATALMAFAAVIEFLQTAALSGRDAELLDWVAGGAGILMAMVLTTVIRRLTA
jgi:VanZ family protein